jgi:hypothetical protein
MLSSINKVASTNFLISNHHDPLAYTPWTLQPWLRRQQTSWFPTTMIHWRLRHGHAYSMRQVLDSLKRVKGFRGFGVELPSCHNHLCSMWQIWARTFNVRFGCGWFLVSHNHACSMWQVWARTFNVRFECGWFLIVGHNHACSMWQVWARTFNVRFECGCSPVLQSPLLDARLECGLYLTQPRPFDATGQGSSSCSPSHASRLNDAMTPTLGTSFVPARRWGQSLLGSGLASNLRCSLVTHPPLFDITKLASNLRCKVWVWMVPSRPQPELGMNLQCEVWVWLFSCSTTTFARCKVWVWVVPTTTKPVWCGSWLPSSPAALPLMPAG